MNPVTPFYVSLAATVASILLILVVLLHYSTVISRLSDQNVVLAQRLALLEQRSAEVDRDAVEAPAVREPGAELVGEPRRDS